MSRDHGFSRRGIFGGSVLHLIRSTIGLLRDSYIIIRFCFFVTFLVVNNVHRAELLTPDFSRVRVLIGHDGHVHWEPGGVFTTTCDIDVRYFPFDDQLCMIEFGAWAYYSARVNITSVSDSVSVRNSLL